MNELGITFCWLLVQVTVVACAGLVLSALAGRRAGAGTAPALAALLATLALAALACCPLPAWWTWEATLPTATNLSSTATSAPPAVDGLPLATLLAWLHGVGRATESTPGTQAASWSWPALLAMVAVAGAGCGLARLLLGLWALHRGQRRSRPLADPRLRVLVTELCGALRVRRPVELREMAELPSAATVGWRRPVVLLPSDWRGWTAAQLRAALAHELAHVSRGDFAAWVLARLSVAIHCWHPLVRLLARQLQLQQELAADALAAPLAGGRAAYLRALADLALRADGPVHGWAAPAFLSRTGILLRRIAMLRVMEDGPQRPATRRGRWLTVTLLAGLTLAVSAWRFPVAELLAGSNEVATAVVAPFDLSLLAPGDGDEHDGVYGARPAALFSRAYTEPQRKLINAELDLVLTTLAAGKVGIHIEDVEQVLGRVNFGGTKEPGKRTLMLSLNALRMTRDIDWVKLRDRCGKLFTQHHWQGDTYVHFVMPPILQHMIGAKKPGPGYLWAADARTLIFDTEASIKARIEAKAHGKKLPLPEYAPGWEHVSRGLFALALDNRNGRIVKRYVTSAERDQLSANPAKGEYHLLRFCEQASHVVFGVGGADDFHFDLEASAATPEAAAKLAEHSKALVAVLRKRVADEGLDDVQEAFVRKVLERPTVHRHGNRITVHAETASGFDALLTDLLSVGAVKSR